MSDQNFQPTNSDNNQPGATPPQEISQLSHAVKHSIRRYLFELDGTQPNNMYELVLRQVEQPLFEAILPKVISHAPLSCLGLIVVLCARSCAAIIYINSYC